MPLAKWKNLCTNFICVANGVIAIYTVLYEISNNRVLFFIIRKLVKSFYGSQKRCIFAPLMETFKTEIFYVGKKFN